MILKNSILIRKVFLLAFVSVFFFATEGGAQSPMERLRASLQQSSDDSDSSSALPAEDNITPRSPGFSLPAGEKRTDAADPFAAVAAPAPQSPEEVKKMIRQEALDAALTGLLPLNPEDIRKLLERFDDTQQAVEVPIYPYPEPEVVVETISLDPGSKPPVIKLGVGHVTTLNILDATGAPWPIQDLTYAGKFEVVTPEEGGHVVRVTAMSEFGYGNMSVRLLDLETPITFTLKTARDSVYYRFDARVPEYGPFAEIPLIAGGSALVAGDDILGSILDGIPPTGSEKLKISGVDGRTTAYAYNQKTYVRTPLTLLSPGWSGSVSSADGMNVYAVSNAPVLLLSDRGQVVRASLKEEDPIHE